MAANSRGVGGSEGTAVTAVTGAAGGEARLGKRSPCLWQRLSVSQSRIYHRPEREAVLDRSPAVSPRSLEVPKSPCCVRQGRPAGLGLSPEGTGTPVSLLHAVLGISISPVVVDREISGSCFPFSCGSRCSLAGDQGCPGMWLGKVSIPQLGHPVLQAASLGLSPLFPSFFSRSSVAQKVFIPHLQQQSWRRILVFLHSDRDSARRKSPKSSFPPPPFHPPSPGAATLLSKAFLLGLVGGLEQLSGCWAQSRRQELLPADIWELGTAPVSAQLRAEEVGSPRHLQLG